MKSESSQWPSKVTAYSTAVLAVITFIYVVLMFRYVKLTEELVLLGQTPDVELTLDTLFGKNRLVIENSGPQPVLDIKVWWTAYTYHEPRNLYVGAFFQLEPAPGHPQAWWELGRLGVGEQGSKELSDLVMQVGHNIDASYRMHYPPSVARLVFTMQYRRAVDRKPYRASVTGMMAKDANTGAYFLFLSPESVVPAPPP